MFDSTWIKNDKKAKLVKHRISKPPRRSPSACEEARQALAARLVRVVTVQVRLDHARALSK